MKALLGMMLALMLIGTLTLAFDVQPVNTIETIYLRTDESVNSYAPLMYTYDVCVNGTGPARIRVPDPYFGMIIPVFAAVENQGSSIEDFKVRLFYDTTLIGELTMSNVQPGYERVWSLSWDMQALPNGVYTISANASTLPGETDTADNYLVGGTVRKTFYGEVTGDEIVDAYDLFDLSKAYGSMTLSADINSDGTVDMTDYYLLWEANYRIYLGYLDWNPYADLDKDGDVDWVDFGDFATVFGWKASVNWNPYADMNADNKIDAFDIFNVSKNYGKTG